jgi:toxin ParE1/3/4
MHRILYRPAARNDLIRQWIWYADNAGAEVADRFLVAADKTLQMLASQPEAGLETQFSHPLLAGLRRFRVQGGFGSILVFYFPLRDGIDVVRLLHGSRHIEEVLSQVDEPLRLIDP